MKRSVHKVMRQGGHSGVMVAFFLAPEDAKALALEANSLPDGAEPLPADELHLTLAFLGDAADLEVDRETVLAQLQAFASEAGPVGGTVSGIGRFSAPDGEKTPLYASFDSPVIAEWRAELKSDLGAAGAEPNGEHGFTPHITLAYLPADAPMPDIPLPQRELIFDTLALAWADDIDLIDLQGKAREMKSMNPKRSIFQRAIAQFVASLEEAFSLGEAPAAAPPVVGQPASAPAATEATPAAKNKRALASGQLFQQVYQQTDRMYPGAWLLDVYFDDGGALFAILASDGKLYRCDITQSGNDVTVAPWREVVAQFADTAARATPERTKLVRQQVDGKERVRWFSVSCTAVLNRVGEIDSRDLFDSFVEHAERTGEYPIRIFYHAGDERFRTGQADFLARDGNTYVTSGLYDDTELAQAEIAARTADPDFWGDSIGYDVTAVPDLVTVADGIQIPVYRQGINREISTLPEAEAAALMTRSSLEEVIRMNDKQMQALIKLFGGDEAKARAWLEANPGAANRAIDEAGLLARSAAPAAAIAPAVVTTPVAPAPAAAAPKPPTPAADQAVELGDSAVAEIVARTLESDVIKTLTGQVATLTGLVEQMNREASARNTRVETSLRTLYERLSAAEVDDETKLREAVEDLPARRRLSVTYRPRHAAATEDDSETVDSMAEVANQTLEKIKAD